MPVRSCGRAQVSNTAATERGGEGEREEREEEREVEREVEKVKGRERRRERRWEEKGERGGRKRERSGRELEGYESHSIQIRVSQSHASPLLHQPITDLRTEPH